jgi:Phage tail tube protein, GTA-gp10
MSRDASILLPFAGSEFIFRLATGQWQKIEAARDCGPLVVLDRLHNGQWRADDIREVIRWGLIGGGMSAAKAADYLRDFVDAVPLIESLLIAQKVAMAGYIGAGEEDPASKKNEEAATPNGSTISPTEKSDGANSTGLAPSSDTRQPRSTA